MPETEQQPAKPESEKDSFQNCARVAQNCVRVANRNLPVLPPSRPKNPDFRDSGPNLLEFCLPQVKSAQVSCFAASPPT